MALYKDLVLTNGERQVLNILEQYNGIIKVVPKIRFFDVIDWNSKMEYNEHLYLEKTHYDSMVCENKTPYRFLFGIKYDGIGIGYTTSDKNRDWKLNLKKRISEREGCPLLVIHQSDLPNLDDMIKEQIFTTYWKTLCDNKKYLWWLELLPID